MKTSFGQYGEMNNATSWRWFIKILGMLKKHFSAVNNESDE
jgi:hypothetical protein